MSRRALLLFGAPGFSIAAAAGLSRAGSVAAGDGEVWWNEEWSRVLEMSGSWAVQAKDDMTVLHPGDPSCKLVILARATGEVFEYEMRPEGQVSLAFGWIMISTERPNLIRALSTTQPESELPFAGFSGSLLPSQRIERIEWRGAGEWLLRGLDMIGRRFYAVGVESSSPLRNELVVHKITGEVRTYPGEEHRACCISQRFRHRLPEGTPRREFIEVGGLSR